MLPPLPHVSASRNVEGLVFTGGELFSLPLYRDAGGIAAGAATGGGIAAAVAYGQDSEARPLRKACGGSGAPRLRSDSAAVWAFGELGRQCSGLRGRGSIGLIGFGRSSSGDVSCRFRALGDPIINGASEGANRRRGV